MSGERTRGGSGRTESDRALDRKALLELILEVSFECREVTLTSGKKSSFYLDLRQTLMRPRGVELAGRLILDRL